MKIRHILGQPSVRREWLQARTPNTECEGKERIIHSTFFGKLTYKI